VLLKYKSFNPITENNSNLAKLPEEWRIYELIKQHYYITSHGFGSLPDSEKEERSEKKIIKITKKILNKDIKKESIPLLSEEIENFFYGEHCKITNKKFGAFTMLGPIGSANITPDGLLLDLDDIKEVYVETELDRIWHTGCILSEKCGWIYWMLTQGDKPLPNYEYLVTFNHHKKETAFGELTEKYIRFKRELTSRKFKRFFSSDYHWFHAELEKLQTSLPYINFFNY